MANLGRTQSNRIDFAAQKRAHAHFTSDHLVSSWHQYRERWRGNLHMGDAGIHAPKPPTETALPASQKSTLDTAARKFADELVNTDYSTSKYLPGQVKKYDDDQHLSPAARVYLARRIAADNSADRLNAETAAKQSQPQTHWYDRLKGLFSNDHLEKNKTLPKVILGTTAGRAEISGVDADALPEHQLVGEPLPGESPKVAPEPARQANPNADYPDTAIGQDHAFTDTLNLNKK
jgi:hypothetical protein